MLESRGAPVVCGVVKKKEEKKRNNLEIIYFFSYARRSEAAGEILKRKIYMCIFNHIVM